MSEQVEVVDIGNYRQRAAELISDGVVGNHIRTRLIERVAVLLETEAQKPALTTDNWKLIHLLAKEKLEEVHSQPRVSPFVSTSKLYSLAKMAEQKLKAEGEWE